MYSDPMGPSFAVWVNFGGRARIEDQISDMSSCFVGVLIHKHIAAFSPKKEKSALSERYKLHGT